MLHSDRRPTIRDDAPERQSRSAAMKKLRHKMDHAQWLTGTFWWCLLQPIIDAGAHQFRDEMIDIAPLASLDESIGSDLGGPASARSSSGRIAAQRRDTFSFTHQ
jgi:hypothetical protein